MASNLSFDDLFDDTKEIQTAPGEGGGMDLSTGGPRVRSLAGVFDSFWAYRFWVAKEVGEPGEDGKPTYKDLDKSKLPATARLQEFDSGAFLLFLPENLNDCNVTRAAFSVRNQASKVLRFEVDLRTNVIGWRGKDKTPVEAFGRDFMDYTVQHNAFEVGQYGAGLHLEFLPSLVQAFLMAAGKLAEPVFDYKKLAEFEKPTPELQEIYIDGYLDGSGVKQKGKLVEARERLWEIAGESDWTKWSNSGNDKVTSRLLAKALAIFHEVSMSGLVLEIGQVAVPHVSAVSKKGQPNLIPVVYRMWRSRADAEAELAVEGEEADNAEKVPSGWESTTHAEFVDALTKFLVQYAPKPSKTKPEMFFNWLRGDDGKQKLADYMGLTVEETLPYLQETGFPFTQA